MLKPTQVEKTGTPKFLKMAIENKVSGWLRRLVIVVLVVVTLLLIFDFYKFSFFKIVPNFTRFAVVAPVQEKLNELVKPFNFSIDTIKNDYKNGVELLQVKNELAEKRIEVHLLKKLYNYELKKNSLLSNISGVDVKATIADVIAHEPERHFMHLIINKGYANGVEEGMPVVSFQSNRIALVGFVLEIGQESALVQTLLDQRTQVSVQISTHDSSGILSGQSVASQYLQLDFLDKNIDSITGLEVFTSGIGQKYPFGIPVGKISYRIKKNYLIYQSAYVLPYTNFFTLREVFLLPKFEMNQAEIELEEK